MESSIIDTNKRKRTVEQDNEEAFTDLVVIGITCTSNGLLGFHNETVLTSMEYASSYVFKDGSSIPQDKLGNELVFSKRIEGSDMRPFVTHCRGGVVINDLEKQPPFPNLFVNYYSSRQYNSAVPKRKEVTPLNGRVIGFVNLIVESDTDTIREM
jgi:hypothetical protein